MIAWLQRIIALKPSEQLTVIEHQELTLEERVERLLSRLGHKNALTQSELDELITDLETVIDIVDKIVATLENIGGADGARNLRKRLRNHATRAKNAREKMKAA